MVVIDPIDLILIGKVLDITMLRGITTYESPLSLEHPLIQNFWEVLDSFNTQEQILFLRYTLNDFVCFLICRFVWGRSTLPRSLDLNVQFVINLLRTNEASEPTLGIDGSIEEKAYTNHSVVDTYLPEARTCFFTLSLPLYSTRKALREKLLYAISTCNSIDSDFLVHNSDTQRMEEIVQHRTLTHFNDYSGSVSILDSEASFYFSELH